MQAVTSLEPRTLRQPEKLRRCRRTSMFLLLLFLESNENRGLYLLYLQASATSPQPHEQIPVQRRNRSVIKRHAAQNLCGRAKESSEIPGWREKLQICENPANSAVDNDFRESTISNWKWITTPSEFLCVRRVYSASITSPPQSPLPCPARRSGSHTQAPREC